jgi:hypothetical protein
MDITKNQATIIGGSSTVTLAPQITSVDLSSLDMGTISISDPLWTTTTSGTAMTPGYAYTIGPNTVSDLNWANAGAGAGAMHVNQSGRVTLMGENADIDLNGKSLKTWMERVEERLNILTPNAELEKEWDELRRLGERYRKLEKKCKEKAEMWNKLKSMPAVKTPK